MVSLLTMAFDVEGASINGVMLLASGLLEAAAFVTAWQIPSDTPAHSPTLREPRWFGEVDGSVPAAKLVTLPSQTVCVSHRKTAPDADAADGPAGNRAGLTTWPSP